MVYIPVTIMPSPTPIRLIQFRAAYNLPVHAAVENGIFAGGGLAVEIEYTPGSAYLVEAVRTGRCIIGHAAADDVVADVENQPGSDLFAFMGLHSGLLSLVGAPGCPTMESLRGKPLAVDARDSGFVFILEKALRDHGFGPDDYELVEVGGWESRYQTLIEGKLHATLLTPPFVGAALERGCHIIARGEEMAPVYQATVGLAKRSWAEDNRTHLVNYIRCYVAATEWCFAPENRRALPRPPGPAQRPGRGCRRGDPGLVAGPRAWPLPQGRVERAGSRGRARSQGRHGLYRPSHASAREVYRRFLLRSALIHRPHPEPNTGRAAAQSGLTGCVKPHPREATVPEIVIPAKAGIQAGWSGETPRRDPSRTPGFPLSRE